MLCAIQAPQLINTILKPFEVLTRSFLWRGKTGEAAGGQAAAGKEEPLGGATPAAGQPANAAADFQPRREVGAEAFPLPESPCTAQNVDTVSHFKLFTGTLTV